MCGKGQPAALADGKLQLVQLARHPDQLPAIVAHGVIAKVQLCFTTGAGVGIGAVVYMSCDESIRG